MGTLTEESGFGVRVTQHKALVCALALLVLSAGGVGGGAAAAPSEERLFVPGESLGGLELGASKAEVRRVWGERHGVCRSCRQPTWYFNERPFEPQGTGVVLDDGRAAHLFTMWQPEGWRTPDGLSLGADEAEVTRAQRALIRRRCAGYDALVVSGGRAQSVFYLLEGELFGFGLTRPDANPCL